MDSAFYEKCDLYLSGDLPAEEKAAFEQSLQADSAMAEEFELFQKVNKSLSHQVQSEAANEKLGATLNNFNAAFFKKKQKDEAVVIPMYKKYWLPAVGVAVMLILVFGIFQLLPQGDLYEQYAQHITPDFSTKSGDEKLAAEVGGAFENKAYAIALKKLDELLQSEPSDARYLFYKGICLLELNEFEKANAIFIDLENNRIFRNAATWYIALNWLKQEKYEACRNILENIPSESEYFEEAQTLLEDLSKKE